ncbi:MAG TPA: tyrosine-protein phosphatase [Roseiflexaceae bacterium]|nr:tyrosine-protein phosphatase [Roseiflexaceae bacterium]
MRRIELEGAFNVRDVGGYPTHDGRTTRWRRLLRADSLHRLTPADQRALLEYGVRTIIDLRRPSEVARDPNVFAAAGGVAYRNLPLFGDELTPVVETPARSLDELYRLWLDHCHTQIGAVLAGVAEAEAAPVVVHCFVGKDRTGLVVALALGAAGVPHETIADDYALSAGLLAPLIVELRERVRLAGEDLERYDRMTISPREKMLGVLGYLDERYGGVPGYLEAIGLSAAQVERLRRLLLE